MAFNPKKTCRNIEKLECGPILTQRDGRPAEHRWRPLFNAAVWLTTTTGVPCSNYAVKTRNPLKLAAMPQTTGSILAASGPKFTILCGHLEILLLNFFSDCRYVP